MLYIIETVKNGEGLIVYTVWHMQSLLTLKISFQKHRTITIPVIVEVLETQGIQ